MIRIEIGKFSLMAQGHGGTAPKGQDLLCAGVSTLLVSLAKTLQDMEKAGLCQDLSVCLESGYGALSCRPTVGAEGGLTWAFQTVYNGLMLLQQLYPKHICLQVESS